MDDEAIRRWAQSGRTRSPRRSAETSPGTPAANAPQLPQPLPGYAWAWNGAQWVQVALPGAPPVSTPSYGAPPATHQPGPPGQVLQFPMAPRTNFLVREGDINPWDRITQVPDIPVQDPFMGNRYDAMSGNMSPMSRAALAPLLSEYPEAGQMIELPLRPDSTVRLQDTHRDRGAGRE